MCSKMIRSIFAAIIIILISIVTGMIVAIIVTSKTKYHGPNAKKVCKKIYYNSNTKKCLKFYVKPLMCPKKRNYLEKIYALVGKKI